MSKFKGGKGQTPTCPKLLKIIVETLFPSQSQENYRLKQRDMLKWKSKQSTMWMWLKRHRDLVMLKRQAWTILKIAINHNAKPFTELFTQCFRKGVSRKFGKGSDLSYYRSLIINRRAQLLSTSLYAGYAWQNTRADYLCTIRIALRKRVPGPLRK